MKTCPKCQQTKPLADFNVKTSSPDGRQAHCRMCAAGYHAAASPERLAALKKRKKEQRKRARAEILAYLQSHPCVDCGFADPRALDFDHVRGIKVTEISRMVSKSKSISAILSEIEKCEVRCANCHRIIMAVRRNGKKQDSVD